MKKEADFTTGPILSKLIKFMLPVLATLFLQIFYSAADLLIVGQFSTTASVSGVSMGTQVTSFMTCIIAGLTTALTVILGQYIGSREKKAAGDAIGAAIIFFLILTAAIVIILFASARPALLLLNVKDAEALHQGINYIRICSVGYIFVTAFNVVGGIFRGIGDSKTPLITVGVACVINIFLDLLLVAVFDMAAAGAAIATVFAQAVSVFLSLLFIKKKGLPFEFGKKNIKANAKLIKRLLKLGFPLAINEIVLSVSFLVLSALLNDLDSAAPAAVGVVGKLCNFIMVFTGAFDQSLAAFVAQNAGAKNLKRAKVALLHTYWIGAVVGVVMFWLAFFHGAWFTGIFSKDPAVISMANDFLKIYALDTLFSALMFSTVGFFNGLGLTAFTMINGFWGVIVRIPAAILLAGIPAGVISAGVLSVSLLGLESLVGAQMFITGLSVPISSAAQLLFCWGYYLIKNKKIKEEFAPAENNPAA